MTDNVKLKRNEVKELLPILEAFSKGVKIQGRMKGTDNIWNNEPYLNEDIFIGEYEYRIKPELILRPWKPEEVPVGCLLRYKNYPETVFLCLGYNSSKISEPIFDSGNECLTFEQALKNREHSIDKGKTWLPCGVISE